MRLSRLDLLAYGPFSGTQIDFEVPSPGLHVVFGPNEAGKSTTLRAVLGLLFGIHPRTPDAHQHAMKDLRIGGVVERAGGHRLEVVRRKGRKDTLLDPEGRPIGDDALSAFLGGVTASLFESAFGLDHVSLRAGAEAMLAGGGDVGESLFGASAGGGGVRRVLDRLTSEADALFTPRGRSRKLVIQSIAAVRDGRRALEDATTRPEGYTKQKRALDEATAHREALRAHQVALKAEQSRLLRILKVTPLLGQRERLVRDLSALGDVPDLAPEFRDVRLAVEEELREVADEIRHLGHLIREAEERLGQLSVPEALLQVDRVVIEAIEERLGRHRAAVTDMPKVQAKLQAAWEDVEKGKSSVGAAGEGSLEQRPPAPLMARVRSLARQMARLGADVEHAAREVAAKRAHLGQLEARLGAMPEPADDGVLDAVVAAVQEEGDPEARLRAVEKQIAELRRGFERALGELGSGFTVDAVRAFHPPSPEALDAAERRSTELCARLSRAEERREAFRSRLIEAEREIDALRGQGDVPTEEQLAEARSRRSDVLVRIRGEVGAGARVACGDLDELGARIDDADGVADRLRREADRAARLASLSAEQRAASKGLSAAEEQIAVLLGEQREAREQWRAVFSESRLSVASPSEMRGVLSRLRETRRALADLDDALEQQAAVRERLAELSARLLAAEKGVGLAEGGVAREDLAARLRRARKWLAAAEHDRMQRRSTEDALVRAKDDVAAAEALLSASEQSLAEWKARWAASMAELGRPHDTPPDEALALLDALSDLWGRIDVADGLQRRIEGMQRDSRSLAADVQSLCARVLPQAADLDPFDAASLLVRRYAEAVSDHRTRQALSSELAEARARLSRAEGRQGAALERRAALCRAAGAVDAEQLEVVERRVEEARGLRRQLEEIDRSVIEAGDGAQVAELAAEMAEIDSDEAKSRLNEIDSELAEVEDERDRAAQEVATLAHGLERYGGGGAAAAALELQLRTARLEGEVRRYLSTRLAVTVLAREIERFREQHQGPVLSRASEIFPRLTLGRYAALRTGFSEDDRACLRCVRSDGAEVGVEGLSDGTRDQLYLALRLATLERQAAQGEPMPLLLDDALVHFDDERAAAALAVLGEVARTNQVLFFTHHARLVELAEQAVDSGQLGVHRLAGAPS